MKLKTKKYNQKLADAIELSHLNQSQICKLLDIHRTTMYRIITGTHKPRRSLIKLICQILNESKPSTLGLEL